MSSNAIADYQSEIKPFIFLKKLHNDFFLQNYIILSKVKWHILKLKKNNSYILHSHQYAFEIFT